MGGGSLKGILVVGIIMFFVLMPFFALKEIGRDIGDGKLYELFFIRRTKYTPQQSLSYKIEARLAPRRSRARSIKQQPVQV